MELQIFHFLVLELEFILNNYGIQPVKNNHNKSPHILADLGGGLFIGYLNDMRGSL